MPADPPFERMKTRVPHSAMDRQSIWSRAGLYVKASNLRRLVSEESVIRVHAGFTGEAAPTMRCRTTVNYNKQCLCIMPITLDSKAYIYVHLFQF